MCKAPYAHDCFFGGGTRERSWNRLGFPRDVPYAFGTTTIDARYPLFQVDWRDPGPVCPLASDYLNNVGVEFSLANAQHVATLGNRLVRQYGDVTLAVRKAQALEMRKMEPQVEAARHLIRHHSELRGHIRQLRAIGALPHFRGDPPEPPKPPGLPYDGSRAASVGEKSGMM